MADQRMWAGHYELGDLLGHGGWGAVYEGTGPLGERAAVKWLNASSDLEWLRARQEIETLGTLWHPHVVALWDHGELEGSVWLAMERGTASLSQRPPRDLETLHLVVRGVLQALIAAHSRGIVHRDLKPSNLIWSEAGVVRVADFGAAWHRDTVNAPSAGTLGFMAPEQRAGDLWDQGPWTDLFAIGRMVQEWWPQADGEWCAWGVWLTEPDPGRRPRDAAAALRTLPMPRAVRLSEVVDEHTAVTRAEQGAPDLGATLLASWGEGSIPCVRPRLARRRDRVGPSLRRLVAPPLFGREIALDDLWTVFRQSADGPRVHGVKGPRGMGHTAVLDAFCELAGHSGAVVWRSHPGQDLRAFVGSILRVDRDESAVQRWCRRRGVGGLEHELVAWLSGDGATPPSLLARLLAAEAGPRLVVSERPDDDLRHALIALGGADVAVAVVISDPGIELDHFTELLPLPQEVLDAGVNTWTEVRDGSLHRQVQQCEGRPGTLIRWVRGSVEQVPEAIAEHPALAALAWWPVDHSLQDFRRLCDSQCWQVPVSLWVKRGWVEVGATGVSVTDPSLQKALRAERLPAAMVAELARLQPDDGARALLWGQMGQTDRSQDCWVRHARRLRQEERHHTVRSLTRRLLVELPRDHAARAELVDHRIAALHHIEGHLDELTRLALPIVENRSALGWENAVNALCGAWLMVGEPSKALALLESARPLSERLVETHLAVLFDSGRYDEVEASHQGLRRATILKSRGEAALMRGDVALADRLARDSIELGDSPINRMQCGNLLAACAVTRGDISGAELRFRAAAAEGVGMVDCLQPLTNAAACAAMNGARERALRDAEYLLPRLLRIGWAQNVAWVRLVLWATVDDPDVAEGYGSEARSWFARAEDPAICRLAEMAAEHAERRGHPALAATARAWIKGENQGIR